MLRSHSVHAAPLARLTPVDRVSRWLSHFAIDPEIAAALDRLPTKVNDLGYDAWGFSPRHARPLISFGRRIHDYFRPEVVGAENIPDGRVLIVPNHSGQLPLDGVVIGIATLLRCDPPRLVRAMVDRWFPGVPFLNELLSRAGATLGAPINCRNLLLDEQAILVFPEGARGSGKVWKDRYKLRRFGRGFMRLALETGSPIVPTAVIGGEESVVSLYDLKPLARLLGIPYAPIHPLLPLLGLAAYFPLPVRFKVIFGAPMTFAGRHDDEDAAIDEKVAVVQSKVQSMVDEALAARTSIF
jgi:1-acyl-sn-glycerol-3-phosphate acyltransferase